MNKVYIVTSEVVTYDDFNSDVEGVFTNKEKAMQRLREAIERLCWNEKENLEEDYECEDEDDRVFDTFEECWDDWVRTGFVTPNFWRYSNECDMTIVVCVAEREVED